jgi:hypothetical protein
MQEHRTTDSESSSLPTPAASEAERGHQPESKSRARGGQVTLSGQFLELFPTPIVSDAKGTGPADAKRDTTQLRAMNILLPTVTTQESHSGPSQLNRNTVPLNALVGGLLPTPVASEGTKASAAQSSSRRAETGQVFLTNIIHDVAVENGKPVPQGNQLPTPTASDWKGANHSGSGSASSRGMATVVEQTNWGKFEPAIRRWEQVIERPAPAPTKPDGKDGNHRLSSKFTEWMMGLPDGWITDVGLTRNEELKACGNGVVPQQAELALRVLLEGISFERGVEQVNLPTPTVSDTFTANLKSTQQKPGSMHSVTLPQAMKMLPTPTTMDAKATNTKSVAEKFLATGKQTCLTYEIITRTAEEQEQH